MYYLISGLFNCVLWLVLSGFIYCRNPRGRVARAFVLMGINVSFWSFGYTFWQFYQHIQPNAEKALFWIRIAMIGPIIIPAALTEFALRLTRQERKYQLFSGLNLLACLGLLLFSQSSLYIQGLFPILSFPYWPDPGPLLHLQVSLFLANVLFAHFLMVKYYLTCPLAEKKKLKLLIVATSIAYSGGVTNYFLWYKIPIPPLGNILVSALVGIIMYAILRHQLFDIRLVIRRTLVYGILVSTISMTYLLIVITTEKWFQNILNYRSIGSTILSAILIAFAFQPFKQWLENWLSRYFFKDSHLEMARQNEQLQQQLRQSEKLAAIGQFAAGMAHEIRNPLAAIQTFADYIPQRKSDPVFLEQLHQVLSRETRRLNGLISRVLGFAKPSELKLEETALDEIINDALQLLAPKFQKAGVRVSKNHSHQNLVLLPLDREKMYEVFANLLTNSIEAMPNGGEITIESEFSGNEFVVRIKDTGEGIPEENLAHLFEPFYTTKPAGTGLGMNIVKSIIEAHKGKIFVQSKEGKGTTVEVRLPVG